MKMILLLITFLCLVTSVNGQSNDTVYSKVLWLRPIDRKCLLIGTISMFDNKDTIIILSDFEKKRGFRKLRKIRISQSYIFVLKQPLVLPSPPKHYGIYCDRLEVWSNKESKKAMPRICINCYGKFVE